MTTPQPAALPEPELGYIKTDKSNQPAFSARQMRAALQSQPAAAGVSDAELRKAVDALRDPGTVSAFYNGYYTLTPDELRRAMLALRPQAVPMTYEQRQQAFNKSWATSSDFFAGIEAAEAHHGITAQGAQGGEG